MVLGRVSRRWGHMLSVVQLAPGRLRARTPSGGSGPLQLRPCAPFAANSCGSGLGSANPRRPQGLRPFMAVGPTALPCAGGHPPQRPPLHHATLAPRRRRRVYAADRSPTSCRQAARRDHSRFRPCANPAPPINTHSGRGRPCACPAPQPTDSRRHRLKDCVHKKSG